MSDTITVRVVRSMFGRGRTIYRRGDTLEVPPDVLTKHPNTLERVDGDAVPDREPDEPDAEDETVEVEGSGRVTDVETTMDPVEDVDPDDLDPHPSDLKVPELEERLADVDDVDLLETILEAERDGDDRTTAAEAIESRLNDLEG